MPNFDVRVGEEGHAIRTLLNPPSASIAHRVDLFTKIEAAKQQLEWSIPGLSIETHPVPEVITARGTFLTPPNPKADAAQIVRNFLLATAPLYGLSQAEVRALATTANYANPAGNLKWVGSVQQHFGGVRRDAMNAAQQVSAVFSAAYSKSALTPMSTTITRADFMELRTAINKLRPPERGAESERWNWGVPGNTCKLPRKLLFFQQKCQNGHAWSRT